MSSCVFCKKNGTDVDDHDEDDNKTKIILLLREVQRWQRPLVFPVPAAKLALLPFCCRFASSIGMATGVLCKYFGRKNETLPQLTISCGLSENVQICSRNKQHHCCLCVCLCVCVCVCLYPLVTVPLSGDDPQTRPRSRRNSLNSFP